MSRTNGTPGRRKTRTWLVIAAGVLVLAGILAGGTLLMSRSAHRDASDAAHSVSLLYLEELAGRREQVVENNLQGSVNTMKAAVAMITEEDFSDLTHMQAYQRRMKQLFSLKKFAFVDTEGLIYTADDGILNEMDQYAFDTRTLTGPEISIRNLPESKKHVVIAIPIREENLSIEGHSLTACFMEMDMDVMLSGVSVTAQNSESTFCNIYTREGVALSNTVLGGLAVEDNLLEAMSHADYDEGSSYEAFLEGFTKGEKGIAAFTYNGIQETLCYVPVTGTDWLLTYLVREEIISDRISSVSGPIITRSILLAIATALLLAGVFIYVILQNRKTARLMLENAETRRSLAQQQELQEALAAAEEASRAKTTFLSNMSHEIRTPLNAIIGLDNIALQEPEVPEKVRGHLEKIGTSARHLLDIINDILDMSRIESGRMIIKNEEFSFAGMLEQVNTIIGGQCREKGLHYDCRTSGKIDETYIGDETKLRQVMINILGNAVKFTPEGGSVTFLVEEGRRYEGKAVLKMTFRDTGIGMSREYLPHLFDTFSQEDASSTSKYGSTGLGMPITRSIVELMNGHIEVESEKGKGTTFTVTVTLGEADRRGDGIHPGEQDIPDVPAGKAQQEAAPRASLQGRCVLLAEDVAVNAEIMVMLLGTCGMEADVAENGRIAVDKYLSQPAGRYDAILMDMRMPEMDGLEATRAIRASGREDAESIPIIALTANAFDEDVQRSMQSGLNAHLSKPVEPEILFDTLEKLIR